MFDKLDEIPCDDFQQRNIDYFSRGISNPFDFEHFGVKNSMRPENDNNDKKIVEPMDINAEFEKTPSVKSPVKFESPIRSLYPSLPMQAQAPAPLDIGEIHEKSPERNLFRSPERSPVRSPTRKEFSRVANPLQEEPMYRSYRIQTISEAPREKEDEKTPLFSHIPGHKFSGQRSLSPIINEAVVYYPLTGTVQRYGGVPEVTSPRSPLRETIPAQVRSPVLSPRSPLRETTQSQVKSPVLSPRSPNKQVIYVPMNGLTQIIQSPVASPGRSPVRSPVKKSTTKEVYRTLTESQIQERPINPYEAEVVRSSYRNSQRSSQKSGKFDFENIDSQVQQPNIYKNVSQSDNMRVSMPPPQSPIKKVQTQALDFTDPQMGSNSKSSKLLEDITPAHKAPPVTQKPTITKSKTAQPLQLSNHNQMGLKTSGTMSNDLPVKSTLVQSGGPLDGLIKWPQNYTNPYLVQTATYLNKQQQNPLQISETKGSATLGNISSISNKQHQTTFQRSIITSLVADTSLNRQDPSTPKKTVPVSTTMYAQPKPMSQSMISDKSNRQASLTPKKTLHASTSMIVGSGVGIARPNNNTNTYSLYDKRLQTSLTQEDVLTQSSRPMYMITTSPKAGNILHSGISGIDRKHSPSHNQGESSETKSNFSKSYPVNVTPLLTQQNDILHSGISGIDRKHSPPHNQGESSETKSNFSKSYPVNVTPLLTQQNDTNSQSRGSSNCHSKQKSISHKSRPQTPNYQKSPKPQERFVTSNLVQSQ